MAACRESCPAFASGCILCVSSARTVSRADCLRLASMYGDHRLARVIAEIDAANARDPKRTAFNGRLEPAELVYGWRMTEGLDRIASNASTQLRIAARGQHIERWTCPRSSYPQGRAGYLA